MNKAVITTERLLLREFQLDDFEPFADSWADPVVTAHIGVPARDRAQSWSSFLSNVGHWAMFGYGQWAITDRVTGAYLGQTGFFRSIRGHGAEFDDHPEAGWVLVREAMGKGYGSEATQAAHHWFDQKIGGRTVAQISPENAASQALAAKLGYHAFGKAGPEDNPVLLFRRG